MNRKDLMKYLGGSALMISSVCLVSYYGLRYAYSLYRRRHYALNYSKHFREYLLNGDANVKVHLIQNVQGFLDYAPEFIRVARSSGLMGLDAEWYQGGPVALLQIALVNGHVYLFRLRPQMEGRLPKALITILEDESVIKTGVGVYEDARKLESNSQFSVKVAPESSICDIWPIANYPVKVWPDSPSFI